MKSSTFKIYDFNVFRVNCLISQETSMEDEISQNCETFMIQVSVLLFVRYNENFCKFSELHFLTEIYQLMKQGQTYK